MNRNKSVAPLAGPNFVSPDGALAPGVKLLIPPELSARQERPYVVNADNRAAPPIMLVVVLVADLVIGVLTFLAFFYLGRLDGLMSFLLAIAGVVGIALLALFLLSGDVPALFEIQKSSRIEHKRIAAIRDIALGWVQVAHVQAEAQRTDAQARLLESQNEKAAIEHAMLVDHTQRELNQLQGYQENPSTYTPADPMPDPAYITVIKFVEEKLFANIDPKSGRIKTSVPWGKTGDLSPTEAKRVTDWLDTVGKKAPKGPVFECRAQAWHLNHKAYPTAWLVTQELRRTPLHKR